MSHPSTTLQAGENEGDSVPRWAEVAGHTCGSTTTRSISSRTWRSVASTEQRSLSTRARSWLAICLRSCTVPSGAFSRRIGWPSKRPASASRCWDLGAHAAFGQLGKDSGVTFTGDQRIEHRAAGHAQHRHATDDILR